jgi:hypothetical protein
MRNTRSSGNAELTNPHSGRGRGSFRNNSL